MNGRIARAATITNLAVLLLLGGCAPGIQGGWEASGSMQRTQLFELGISFEEQNRALAVYRTKDAGEVPVPVCSVSVQESEIAFVIDAKGQTDCSTLAHPLSFTGTMGAHVIAGTIRDAAGEQIGIWRAFRKPTQ
ncbi:MAG: hypothetical protein ACI9WU_002601 [Myxococcota bacterium]|jgi:hypothetical protein